MFEYKCLWFWTSDPEIGSVGQSMVLITGYLLKILVGPFQLWTLCESVNRSIKKLLKKDMHM